MGVPLGPFKVILSALERTASPDTLVDPAPARVRSELARLFQLDDETASNIVSAIPIVIVDGLDARSAGVVRDRMQGLREAGCRVVISDEAADTIPRVNWPQLPPIARVDGADEGRGTARLAVGGGHEGGGGGLACPHCGGGISVVAAGPAPRGGPNGRDLPADRTGGAPAQREPEPAPRSGPRDREPARSPRGAAATAPAAADDDWLNPLGTAAQPAASATRPGGASDPAAATAPAERRPSGRFDDAALLAYRSKPEPAAARTPGYGAPPPAPPPAATPPSSPSGPAARPGPSSRPGTGAKALGPAAPAQASATSEVLDVTFTESGELEPEQAAAALSALDEGRGKSATTTTARRPGGGAGGRGAPADDPLDLDAELDEPFGRGRGPGAPPPAPAAPPASKKAGAGRGASRGRDPFEDSLPAFDDAPDPMADPFASAATSRKEPAKGKDKGAAKDKGKEEERDPFASSPSRSGATTSSDPFEDSALFDGVGDLDAPDLSPAPRGGKGGKSDKVGRDPLDDSGSDILDEPPPHRRGKEESKKNQRFESDLDLLDGGLGSGGDLGAAPAPAARGGGKKKRDIESDDILDALGDSDDSVPPAPPPAAPARGGKAGKDAAGGKGKGKSPDLDEVLSMFGPEDDAPLDDGSGLEPAPLDLSPPRAAAGGRKTATGASPAVGGGGGAGGRAGFGDKNELSDILEPLDPGEALEIIKTSKPGRPGRPSTAGANGRHQEEPSGLEELDEGEVAAVTEKTDPKRNAKKSRHVPAMASDEDVGLFEDSRGTAGGRAAKKKTDPFARARGKLEAEEEREKRGDRREPDRGRSAPDLPATGGSDRAPKASKRGGGGNGPAPTGDGEHGLVLSRIAEPEKKEEAAEIIAEVKGCSLDEARRLTDRTIIPVLKGVSREVAEFHLEKFKRVKIAGRVTTRQRS